MACFKIFAYQPVRLAALVPTLIYRWFGMCTRQQQGRHLCDALTNRLLMEDRAHRSAYGCSSAACSLRWERAIPSTHIEQRREERLLEDADPPRPYIASRRWGSHRPTAECEAAVAEIRSFLSPPYCASMIPGALHVRRGARMRLGASLSSRALQFNCEPSPAAGAQPTGGGQYVGSAVRLD